MPPKSITFRKMDVPQLVERAAILNRAGTLGVTKDSLLYLNISDEYIHQLNPYLKALNPKIEVPDYFQLGGVGAHISVIYPEEKAILEKEDFIEIHHFEPQGLFSADILLKRYYVLSVNAPTLVALRKKYALSKKLLFKNFLVDMHITIGVSLI